MSQKSYKNDNGKLYLIPTPIGNLDDITLRSIKALEMVDFLLCEDTRVTMTLLNHLKIKKKLYSCHTHNEESMKKFVISELNNKKNVGLVTDRGTPIVSDPGNVIVDEAIKNNFDVVALPGATALIPALISSGIDASSFLFYGFLDSRKSKKKQQLEMLKNHNTTLIFYESPHRISETLELIKEIFGDRVISLAREISKLYEEIYRGNVSAVLEEIKAGIRGEMVIVVSGNYEKQEFSLLTIFEHVKIYLEDGLEEKEAIKKVAKERNIAKSIIYQEYHLRK